MRESRCCANLHISVSMVEVRVAICFAFEELAHVPRTGGLQVGQQSRNEVWEWNFQICTGGATHLLLHVAPTRFNVLGVIVATVTGQCIGVVTAIAASVALESRSSAVLPDGEQPVDISSWIAIANCQGVV